VASTLTPQDNKGETGIKRKKSDLKSKFSDLSIMLERKIAVRQRREQHLAQGMGKLSKIMVRANRNWRVLKPTRSGGLGKKGVRCQEKGQKRRQTQVTLVPVFKIGGGEAQMDARQGDREREVFKGKKSLLGKMNEH